MKLSDSPKVKAAMALGYTIDEIRWPGPGKESIASKRESRSLGLIQYLYRGSEEEKAMADKMIAEANDRSDTLSRAAEVIHRAEHPEEYGDPPLQDPIEHEPEVDLPANVSRVEPEAWTYEKRGKFYRLDDEYWDDREWMERPDKPPVVIVNDGRGDCRIKVWVKDWSVFDGNFGTLTVPAERFRKSGNRGEAGLDAGEVKLLLGE